MHLLCDFRFGQTGPLAKAAGHDINYVAMSGLLSVRVLLVVAHVDMQT